jgi:hypothetical protein
MNTTLLNENEKQNTNHVNQLLAKSQEERAIIEMDMAVIAVIDGNTSLEKLEETKKILEDTYKERKRNGQSALGVMTAMGKISLLIKDLGGKWEWNLG